MYVRQTRFNDGVSWNKYSGKDLSMLLLSRTSVDDQSPGEGFEKACIQCAQLVVGERNDGQYR
jgi:hypothetical protein